MSRLKTRVFIFIISLLIVLPLFSCQYENRGLNYIHENQSYIYPNPFNPTQGEQAEIVVVYYNNNNTSKVKVSVNISTLEEHTVWSYAREYDTNPAVSDTENPANTVPEEIRITWGGDNENGTTVSAGEYRIRVTIESLERQPEGITEPVLGGGTNYIYFNIIVL